MRRILIPAFLAILMTLGGAAFAAQGTTGQPEIPPPPADWTPASLSHTPSTAQGPIDYIFVEKGARRLSLWSAGWLVKSYAIRLGGNPVGDKVMEGDSRTPEGLYSIAYRNPQSRFHLSLMTSYPSPRDQARAARMGVSPGGAIAIHGLPNDEDKAKMGRIHKYVDWTDGCIAVTDPEIEEIFAMVEPGTPIEIIP